MARAGRALADRATSTSSTATTGSSPRAAARLARALGAPYVTTIHATEYGRHQGWVEQHPQSHIHGVETLDGAARRRASSSAATTCAATSPTSSASTRTRVARHPERDRPARPAPVDDLAALRAELRPARREARAARRPPRLREGLPARARRAAAGDRARRRRPLPRRGLGHRTSPSSRRRPSAWASTAHGTFLGWIGDDVLHSLYRIADLTVVPSLYEPFGLVALEAMASGCPCIVADTGGLREVVPNDDVGLRFRPATRARWREMASACSPTRPALPPRDRGRPSTSRASTGSTWRGGRRRCTASPERLRRGRAQGAAGPWRAGSLRRVPELLLVSTTQGLDIRDLVRRAPAGRRPRA